MGIAQGNAPNKRLRSGAIDQAARPSTQRLLALDLLAGIGRFQDSMFLISLAIAAGDSGFSPGQIGVATGAYLTLSAITAAPKGRLLDRLGTQRPAQLLLVGAAISYVGILLGLGESSLSLLVSSCLLLGTLRLNSGMMMQALWSALSENPQEFAKASARETLITTISQTLGPLVAGGLIAFGDGNLAVASCGVFATGSMIIWSALAPHPDTLGALTSLQVQQKPRNMHRRLIRPLLIGSLLALPLASIQLALASSESGASAAFLVATFTLGSAVTMTALSLNRRVRPIGGAGVALAPVLLSISFLLLALGTPSLGVLAASLVVSGASFSLASVSNRVSIHSLIPRKASNQAFGMLVTGAAAASGVGAILFGQLSESLGLDGASLSFSILLLVAALVILLVRSGSWSGGKLEPSSK